MTVIAGIGFAAAAIPFSSSVAFAASTYLSCEFANSNGTPQVFNFALDEAAGTFGVYVPASGSQRMEKGTFAGGKASLTEGSVAREIDITKDSVIRDKRMVGEKDRRSRTRRAALKINAGLACRRFHGHRVKMFLLKPESMNAKTNIQPRV